MKLFARIFDPYFSIIFVMTYKYRQTASTQHYLSRPVSEGTKGVKRRKWDAGMCEGKRAPRLSQSTSVWSRGRYLTPCTSSSCSTSSGIRPFTVIAYTPRTYLSSPVYQYPHPKKKGVERKCKNKPRTRSLPPRHPAFLRVSDRNCPVEMRRRTRLNAIR